MNKLTFILLLAFSNQILGQKLNINSKILSVQCNENIDAYRFNTRFTKDSIAKNSRIIHFSTTATCCVDFELKSNKVDNIVKIVLKESGTPCECICVYDFIVQFEESLSSDTKFYVNNKLLKKISKN